MRNELTVQDDLSTLIITEFKVGERPYEPNVDVQDCEYCGTTNRDDRGRCVECGAG
jgi:hypothetical protein